MNVLVCMCVCMNDWRPVQAQINGWVNERMNEWMNELTCDDRQENEFMLKVVAVWLLLTKLCWPST